MGWICTGLTHPLCPMTLYSHVYNINLVLKDFEGVPHKIRSLLAMVDSGMMLCEVISIIVFTFIPENIEKLLIVAVPEPV